MNNPTEGEYVESCDRIVKHVIRLYHDSTQSFKIFDQFRPVYEKKFLKVMGDFLKKEDKHWTILEYKDLYIELESQLELLGKIPERLFFPLFEVDCSAVKENILRTLEDLRRDMIEKLELMFSEKIQQVRQGYEALYERMKEKVTTADEYSEMEQFMYELVQEKLLLSNKSVQIFDDIIYASRMNFLRYDETYVKAKEIFEFPGIIDREVIKTEDNMQQYKTEIVAKLAGQKSDFLFKSQSLMDEMKENEGLTDFHSYQNAIKRFNKFNENLKILEAEAKDIMSQEKKMFGKSSEYPEIQTMRLGFDPILELWTSVNEFMTQKRQIYSANVSKVEIGNLDLIQKKAMI